MDYYTIIADGVGGYQVVVTRKDRPELTTTAFPTWTKAREWIDEQRRNRNTDGRATGPAAD